MYQTERSQRAFFSTQRKELQKQRRAKNIKTAIKQNNNIKTRGYFKLKKIHNIFRSKAIIRAKELKLLQ